jgi:hypothetical protein
MASNQLTPIGFSQISYSGPNLSLGVPSFTVNMSAATVLASTSAISGNGTNTLYTLVGTLCTTNNTSLSTLSSPTNGLALTFGSAAGTQTVFGYISNSFYNAVAQAFSASIQFSDPNFFYTVIGLSGNTSKLSVLSANPTVDYGSYNTWLDNPYYLLNNPYTTTYGALCSNNVSFRTVAFHAALWALNG